MASSESLLTAIGVSAEAGHDESPLPGQLLVSLMDQV